MAIQIEEGYVYQNGVLVASIEGSRGEKWVNFRIGNERKFGARFKYNNPGTNAKAWVKAVLTNYTPEQAAAIIEERKVSPADLGEACGWELSHIKTWRKTGQLPATYDERRVERIAKTKEILNG